MLLNMQDGLKCIKDWQVWSGFQLYSISLGPRLPKICSCLEQGRCKQVVPFLRNNSWKPEFIYSFNMGNIIFVQILSRALARDKMQRK